MPMPKDVPAVRAAIMSASARWTRHAGQASYHRSDLRFRPKAATISLRIRRSAISRSEGAQ